MATGIVKRHSKGCPGKDGGRCNCRAGYEAWVYLPREDKKVRKTFRREAEAKSWRADALTAANRGALRTTRRDSRTLAQAVDEFIEGMRSGEIRPRRKAAYKPSTVRTYEQHARIYLKPAELGAIKVGEVQRADVQDFADELLAAELAPGTVSNVLDPIRGFYRRAVDRGLMAGNPVRAIDIPQPGSRRPKRIASGVEAAQLLDVLPGPDRAMWATAFYAGLRRGELQALRVSAVDLAGSRIHVEAGWDQYEGEIDPKSGAGRRTVPLLAVLRDHLDEHLLGIGRGDADLVFGRTASSPFSPPVTDKRAKDVWTEAELRPITLHECRHTFASLLIDSGANPKAVQEFMGHSKIQTTFDVYGHLFPGSHDEVRERMDAYLDTEVVAR